MAISVPDLPPSGGSPPRGLAAAAQRPWAIVTAAALVTACVLLTILRTLTPAPVRVEVDLSASAGTRVALYVNDLTRPPLTQPLIGGMRHVYVFAGIAEDITMLRVDPTDAAAASLALYSVRIIGPEGVVAQFGPEALGGWTTDALAAQGIADGALHLRTTTPQPIITAHTTIPLRRAGGSWTRWLPAMTTPDTTWRLAAIGLILLLVAASIDPARRLHAPVAATAGALALAVCALAGRLPDGPGSAAVAVSRATFVGLSTRPAVVASVVLLVGSALIGWVAASIVPPPRTGDAPTGISGRRLAAGLLVLVAITSPGLNAWASFTATRQFVPQWDYDNILYWGYLTHQGRLPLRDFWFPYGGFFVFDLPLPAGPAFRWLYDVVLFGTFFVAIGRLRGGAAAAVTTALLFVGQRLGLLPGMERYLLAVNVLLAYVAWRKSGTLLFLRAVFWCACAVALFMEPPQLVYSGVPIACILAADGMALWRTRAPMRSWLRARMGDFGIPAAAAIAFCGLFAMTGQLAGFQTFYGRLGDSVAYSAWPTGFPSLDGAGFPRALLVVSCSAVLIALGVYEYRGGGARQTYGETLAGIGLVTLMILQKHFVRWMDEHLFLLAALCPLVLHLVWPGRRRVAESMVAGTILGAVASMLSANTAMPGLLVAAMQSPRRAASDIVGIAKGRRAWRSVNASAYAPERFQIYAAEHAVLDRLRAEAAPGESFRVFALTDDPVLYVLTGQPPVWMSNMYNGSPVYEQTRMVQWLRNATPQYVAVDPDRLTIDGFQKVVRAPLVFSEAAYNYVPLDAVGRVRLFRRRRPAEPPALADWRATLGSDVNIGRVAKVSSFGAASGACVSACADLLQVELPRGGSGAVSLPMTVAGLQFSVTFTRVPDETRYRVLLDRVWFWDVAKNAGLTHAIAEDLPATARVAVRPVNIDSRVLY